MLGRIHTLAISRLAAGVLALALSGAVRVAAAQAPHEGTHRCTCPTRDGHHECACPKCQSAASAKAAAPSPEALAKLPPCHRALYAKEAAKAAASKPPAPPPSPKPDQDCASPLCSLPDGRLAAAPTTDTYLLPEPPALAAAIRVEPLRAACPLAASVAAAPESPPPRS